MLLTDRQTDRQTNATENITSFAKEVINISLFIVVVECYGQIQWHCYVIIVSMSSYFISVICWIIDIFFTNRKSS